MAKAGVTSASSWAGMVPVEDTALAVTDTGIPALYLNGQFATQRNWRRGQRRVGEGVDLGVAAHHLRRTRPRQEVQALGGLLRRRCAGCRCGARRQWGWIARCWWAGRMAFVAAHWPSRNPDRTLGAVLDGAYPYDWLDEAMEQQIRKQWRRWGWPRGSSPDGRQAG